MTQAKIVDGGILALEKAQAGVAERVGLDSEEAVVRLCKEVRRELYEERYPVNA